MKINSKKGKNSGVCLLRGCKNPAHAKGYCSKHYRFIREFGEEKGVEEALKFEARRKQRLKIQEAHQKTKQENQEDTTMQPQLLNNINEDTVILNESNETTILNKENENTQNQTDLSFSQKEIIDDVVNPDICKIEGCNKTVLAKGYCSSHYQIIRKKGEEEGLRYIAAKMQRDKILNSNDEISYETLVANYEHNHEHENEELKNQAENMQLNIEDAPISKEEMSTHVDDQENVSKSRYGKNKGKKCSIDGCEQNALVKGYCGKHYSMIKKYGEEEALRKIEEANRNKTEDGICKVDGCNKKVISKGYCNKHYQQMRSKGYVIPETQKTQPTPNFYNHVVENNTSSVVPNTIPSVIPNTTPATAPNILPAATHTGCKVNGCSKEVFMNGYCKEHFTEHYNSILKHVLQSQLGGLFISVDDFNNLLQNQPVKVTGTDN